VIRIPESPDRHQLGTLASEESRFRRLRTAIRRATERSEVNAERVRELQAQVARRSIRGAGALACVVALATTRCLLLEPLSGLSGGTPSDAARPPPAPDGDGVGEASSPAGEAGVDAHPGIEFVQAIAAQSKNASTTKATFSNAVLPHSAVVVALDLSQEGGQTVMHVTDTMGSSYAILTGPSLAPTGYAFYLAAAFDVSGGDQVKVTATLSATTADCEIYIHEYSGIASFGEAAFNKAATPTKVRDGMTVLLTTVAPNELLFGFATAGAVSPGTQFDVRSTFNANVTEDRIAGTPGSYEVTATGVDTPTGWGFAAASFLGR
jgi:hypothetical protein